MLRLMFALFAMVVMWISAFAQSNLPVPPREEDQYKEAAVQLPPYPQRERLMRFPTNWTNHEIFLDPAAFADGTDGVVRFTLVVRSPSGAESVSHEGIRCETGEKRVYAYGRKSASGDAIWSPARESPWRAIPDTRANRHYFEFWRDLFCDHKVAETRADILRNIPKGGRERREGMATE